MEKFNKEDLQELFELAKGYEIIEEFIEKYNNTNYINFDYNIVHKFTLFLVDPDFDFEKLESQIERISKVLPHIKQIFSKPVLHLIERDEIQPIEAVKKINNDTINHIARHSELWDDLTKDGIKPLKLLTRQYQDNYGIYENLVFCKTIDDILFFVRKNMKTLKNFNYVNQTMEFDLLQRVNHLNYFLALGKLHTGYVRNFDKYYVVSKHCLEGLENIYNTIIPRLKRPVYKKNKKRPTKLKKTNILAMHKDYKHIYALEKYFVSNKMDINLEINNKSILELEKNYYGYCTILSVFSIGHFNFKCNDDAIIDYKKLDVNFEYKKWKLSLTQQKIAGHKTISITIFKDKEYKIILVPMINTELKDEILDQVYEKDDADEFVACFPYEKNLYEEDECCLDISNLESFRRIQQYVLKGMVYADTERKECPFCDHILFPGEKEGTYVCESCKTLITDTICPNKEEPYSHIDILGYEKDIYDIEKYKGEDWLYYRKLEAMMHYRNITRIDDEGNIICPICNKIH